MEEVVVSSNMPIRYRNDTLEFTASFFKSGNEDNLEDVLRKLPGLTVTDEGDIYYKGKRINRVMVEGRDFFGDNPKMATKNVPASVVDRIQVLENFSDDPLLPKLGGDDVAINVVLDERKRMLFGEARLAGNFDERYLAALNTFYFRPHGDLSYVGNVNRMNEPVLSIMDMYRMMMPDDGSNSITLPGGLAAAVENPNTYDNRNLLQSLNFNYQPSKRFSMNGYGLFLKNKSEYYRDTYREYLLQDVSLNDTAMNEQSSTVGAGRLRLTCMPHRRVQLRYVANASYDDSQTGLRYRSTFNGRHSSIQADREQPAYVLTQRFSAHALAGENEILAFNLRHESRRNRSSYIFNPAGSGYWQGMDALPGGRLQQNINLRQDKLSFMADWYHTFSKTAYLDLRAGIAVDRQKLVSDMDSITLDGEAFAINRAAYRNNDIFTAWKPSAAVFYHQRNGMFTWRAGAQMQWYHFAEASYRQLNSTCLLPSLRLMLQPNRRNKIIASYTISEAAPDVMQLSRGLVVDDYRTLSLGNDSLMHVLTHQYYLDYSYMDGFSHTNLMLNVTYNKTYRNIRNHTQIDPYALQTYSPVNSSPEDMLSFSLLLRKRIVRKLDFVLKGKFGYGGFEYRQNNASTDYTAYSNDYTLSFEYKPATRIRIRPGYRFVYNTYSATGIDNRFSQNKPFVELELGLWKGFKIEVNYSFNHYRENLNGATGNSRYSLMNATVEQEWKRFTVGVTGKNLFSNRYLYYNSFEQSHIAQTTCRVMPRFVMAMVKYKF
jgi:hypothetical protein